MERRCKTVENTANRQLRAMGSDKDFCRLWSFPGDNPFATQRGTIPRWPSQEEVQVATNVLTKTDPEMPPQSDRFPNWPKRFTKKYVDWCESRLEDGLCCAHKLFEAPMPITQLQALTECTLLVIPETLVGSPYYNPLFMPKEALKPMYNSGNLTQIMEVYQSMESLDRQKRFVTALAIAGGTIFGAALDSDPGWFGYSMHTTKDVKHINANQHHLEQMAHQVTMTEKYAKSIQSEAHDLEEREGIMEDFLHLMVGLQFLFDHMELISNGISTLLHHRRLSPLLVDRKSVVDLPGISIGFRFKSSLKVSWNLLIIRILVEWIWSCSTECTSCIWAGKFSLMTLGISNLARK